MTSEIVERLNKADLYESSGDYSALSEEAASHIEALEARVRELEEALRPFAEMAENLKGFHGNAAVTYCCGFKRRITIGELSEARAAIKEEK